MIAIDDAAYWMIAHAEITQEEVVYPVWQMSGSDGAKFVIEAGQEGNCTLICTSNDTGQTLEYKIVVTK